MTDDELEKAAAGALKKRRLHWFALNDRIKRLQSARSVMRHVADGYGNHVSIKLEDELHSTITVPRSKMMLHAEDELAEARRELLNEMKKDGEK